jgi:hypothetical protein
MKDIFFMIYYFVLFLFFRFLGPQLHHWSALSLMHGCADGVFFSGQTENYHHGAHLASHIDIFFTLVFRIGPWRHGANTLATPWQSVGWRGTTWVHGGSQSSQWIDLKWCYHLFGRKIRIFFFIDRESLISYIKWVQYFPFPLKIGKIGLFSFKILILQYVATSFNYFLIMLC